MCPVATSSTAFPGAAWVDCQPGGSMAAATAAATAAGGSASAQATAAASAEQQPKVSGVRPHTASPPSTSHALATAHAAGGSSFASAEAFATATSSGHSDNKWPWLPTAVGGGTASADASADASAVAVGCGLAQAVATASASASGVLPASHPGKAHTLHLSAAAYADARAIAYSPACLGNPSGFGCALAEAVATAQVREKAMDSLQAAGCNAC